MRNGSEAERFTRYPNCQEALKIDPPSASKSEPLWGGIFQNFSKNIKRHIAVIQSNKRDKTFGKQNLVICYIAVILLRLKDY
jgi:hypothetical protein